MKYFYTLDVDYAGKLNLNGAIMLQKRQDINGVCVWIFDASTIPFDIGDAVKNGKGYLSNVVSIAF